MNRTNEHRSVLKSLLLKYCPSVYYRICNPGVFPRAEFDLKQINVENSQYEKHILTVNYYDKDKPDRINDIADSLIDEADKSILFTKNFYYQFYYGNDRQFITETDKTIQRIMLTFEVRIYKRSE